MNLLINAAHAIEGQGVITIRTLHRDDAIVVEIADTGNYSLILGVHSFVPEPSSLALLLTATVVGYGSRRWRRGRKKTNGEAR